MMPHRIGGGWEFHPRRTAPVASPRRTAPVASPPRRSQFAGDHLEHLIEETADVLFKNKNCAAQVVSLRRVVLWVMPLSTLNASRARSGEQIVLTALEEASRANGFQSVITDRPQMAQMASAHRIIFDSVITLRRRCAQLVSPELRCKSYFLHFWGGGGEEFARRSCGLSPRQVITPWPDRINTFVGFWPRTAPPAAADGVALSRRSHGGKPAGIILGKSVEYFVTGRGSSLYAPHVRRVRLTATPRR